jgi:predicted DCC family thiol-disulfide oxidoreductase YuxK
MVNREHILFYDGGCGLCHRFVKFTAQRDAQQRFRFAPIGGKLFAEQIPEAMRSVLPESLVLQTASGQLLTRSDAVLYVLAELGGVWRWLASFGRLIPHPLRDAVYDLVARVRYKLFPSPPDSCPTVPPPLRSRFYQ